MCVLLRTPVINAQSQRRNTCMMVKENICVTIKTTHAY